MATVEGDIHDIGKNIVSLLLGNHGFEVVDAGKDVPAETIVACALEHKARIIGLSALMTTTMAARFLLWYSSTRRQMVWRNSA